MSSGQGILTGHINHIADMEDNRNSGNAAANGKCTEQKDEEHRDLARVLNVKTPDDRDRKEQNDEI